MSDEKGTKRRFYNTGEALGFKKATFYESVISLASGDEVDDETVDLIIQAAEYELEGLALAAERAAEKRGETEPGEKKDRLESDYANQIREKLLPLVTSEPKTISEIIEEASAHGICSNSGKSFSVPWVGSVLGDAAAKGLIVKCSKVATSTAASGKTSEKIFVAYRR